MKDVTILFLRRDDQLLLAMKKRGFGVGKWNGVGGKVEAGEDITTAAIRECQEEIGVTPRNLVHMGDLTFRMSHDPSFGHHAHIFMATEWDGEPAESEEMKPQWFSITAIPYKTMLPDDPLWLPHIINGEPFQGTMTLGPHDEVVHSELTVKNHAATTQ